MANAELPFGSEAEGSSQVFFKRRFTFRKPKVLFGASVAVLFGGAALVYLIFNIPHLTWSLNPLLPACFIAAIGGLLFFVGLSMLKQWLTGASILVEISDTGIRDGRVFHPWESIHWVSGHSRDKAVHLFYQLRGGGLLEGDRHLTVDHPLTKDTYDNLIESLSSALHEKHPHLIFG